MHAEEARRLIRLISATLTPVRSPPRSPLVLPPGGANHLGMRRCFYSFSPVLPLFQKRLPATTNGDTALAGWRFAVGRRVLYGKGGERGRTGRTGAKNPAIPTLNPLPPPRENACHLGGERPRRPKKGAARKGTFSDQNLLIFRRCVVILHSWSIATGRRRYGGGQGSGPETGTAFLLSTPRHRPDHRSNST